MITLKDYHENHSNNKCTRIEQDKFEELEDIIFKLDSGGCWTTTARPLNSEKGDVQSTMPPRIYQKQNLVGT